MSPVLVSICTEIRPGEKGFAKPLGNLGCLKMSAHEATNSPMAYKFPTQSAYQLFYMSKHMWKIIIFPRVNQKFFFQ